MKKLILSLGVAVFLCLPMVVYAASIGGAETQGQGKFAIGLDQEFVFDRDLEFDKANWDLAAEGVSSIEKIEIDKLYRTMVKTSYGLTDNLDIYLKLGVADFKAKSDYTKSNRARTGIYDGKNAFAYGFGTKGTSKLGDWLIGADLQYLRHQHDWTPKGDFEGEGNEATIQEWQVAPYVGYKIGNFVPYLGVKYSDLRAKAVWGGADAGDWEKGKADDNVGVFVGTDYKIGKNFSLNIEGRFVDETAMSFGATYKF